MKQLLIIILLTLVAGTVLGQTEREIILLAMDEVNSSFDSSSNNEKSFFAFKADSILALITNKNYFLGTDSKNTVSVGFIKDSAGFLILQISEHNARNILNSFNNDSLDWSRCLLLYQIYNLSVSSLLRYEGDIETWREKRKYIDFYFFYFKILETFETRKRP